MISALLALPGVRRLHHVLQGLRVVTRHQAVQVVLLHVQGARVRATDRCTLFMIDFQKYHYTPVHTLTHAPTSAWGVLGCVRDSDFPEIYFR